VLAIHGQVLIHSYIGVSDILGRLSFKHNDCNSCKFIRSIESVNARYSLSFPGMILYFMQIWIPVVVNAMLGGEHSSILY